MRRPSVMHAIKPTLAHLTVLLAGALLVSVEAGAATRGPTAREAAAARATRPAARSDAGTAELENWLSRLKGRFTLKYNVEEKTTCSAIGPPGTSGVQRCTTQKAASFVSAMECRAIGEGPDLQCDFDKLRADTSGKNAGDPAPAPTIFASNALPSQMLFGIDPAARKIRMKTSYIGASEGVLASLQGNAISFRESCDLPDSRASSPCIWTLRISAAADGHRVLMTYTSRGNSYAFDLTRVE